MYGKWKIQTEWIELKNQMQTEELNNMNINIIIGHRGTGKSHWLNLLKTFYKNKGLKALFFDLDEEMEKTSGKSLFHLFEKGESIFRQWEKRVFQKFINSIPENKTCFYL